MHTNFTCKVLVRQYITIWNSGCNDCCSLLLRFPSMNIVAQYVLLGPERIKTNQDEPTEYSSSKSLLDHPVDVRNVDQ